MGNTVAASCPADVRPIEAYLSENCENVESLGSTRFMKVAKARGDNGYLKVYKVFINQDDSLSNDELKEFQRILRKTGETLSKEPNCLPVRIVLNKGSNCTLLVRTYQKYTLFDRLSTRPFLNEQERIWYIYQLFKALDQCHKAKICHGDLKSQNVLLSSSNWLQITDFASFKPTFIQYDNPSFFTFFFDTSRRQTCHLAPERLISSKDFEEMNKTKGNSWLFESLTTEMDMFSAGCVVYEILNEGRSPFSYGQLCMYRNMTPAETATILEKLLSDVPQRFHTLLKLLLNREPSLRITAEKVLQGDAFSFPQVLDWFYKYVENFRPIEVVEDSFKPDDHTEPNVVFWSAYHDPDHIISRLLSDEEIIFDNLNKTEESRSFAVLVLSLITSNIRSLKGAQSKVEALRLLVKLSYLCDCTIALERILPYFVLMLSDQHITVRVFAIHSIVDLLKPLEPSNVEQSLIFLDYLLPEFMEMLEKRNPPMFVVQTLAADLGFLAQCAYRFHTVGWSLRSTQDDECSGAETLDQVKNRKEELDALGKAVAELFTPLSTSENIVRHCLINPPSLAALFKFFNAVDNKEDNNILIRHMITFLNAKVDWRLRTAVFDALPICLQKRTVDIRSLLQQGLHDFEELVVVRVLHCIHSLIATDLLDKLAIVDLLRDITPFLAHPNKWIRVCVVDILVLLDSRWTLADIHSKLLVEVHGYLKNPILRLNSKVVIMRSLKEPIPRNLWKHLMNDLNDDQMTHFVDRLKKAMKDGGPVQINEPWYRRIGRIGDDDEELKWKLAQFGEHFIKMAIFRKSAGMESELTMRKGKIDLSVQPLVNRQQHVYGRKSSTSFTEAGSSLNNQEWNEMFSKPLDSPITERPTSVNHIVQSSCGVQLQRLLSHKESLYLKMKGAHPDIIGFTEVRTSSSSKLHGVMLTHLHEHTDKIVKIATSPEHSRVVTVSADGSIKIWNERALIGECLGAVRSDTTLYPGHNEKQRTSLRAGDWMNRGQYFATATAKGELAIMDLAASNEKTVSMTRLPKEDGPIEQIHTDNNIVFVRSHHGNIYCLDRRVGRTSGPIGRHEVWSRTVSNGHGLIASSCVDPWKANWMVLSVTNGQMVLWDLRYQQEVSSWATKRDGGVPVRLWANPCSSYNDPQLFAASNIMGDVGIYDVARGSRTRVLWSSLHTPLTYKGERGDVNDGFVTGALCVNLDTAEIFTGDSQGALRKWNLKKPHLSEYLSGNRKFQGNQKIGYQDLIVKDMEEVPVIREYRSIATAEELCPSSATADVKGASCHRTSITDVACLSRDILASASADGVIKIWK